MVTTASTQFDGVNYAEPDATLMRGVAWTPQEDNLLLQLRRQGVSVKEIARRHIRTHTEGAVYCRWNRMKDFV